MNTSSSFGNRFVKLGNLLLDSDQQPLFAELSWMLLRVVAGVVMVHHGLEKLEDIEGFAEAYVSALGLPFPVFFSYCAAFAELIGSPLLVLGLLTRPAALALTSTMAVAIYHHILVAGFAIPYLELSLLYAACFIGFAVRGGGKFAIDALLVKALGLSSSSAILTDTAMPTAEKIAEKERISV